MLIKVGLLAVSPVYYQAPLYRLLAAQPGLDFTAIFASSAGATRPVENGYGRPVDWGVDALAGYRSIFLRRAERNPIGGGPLAVRDMHVVRHLRRERYDALILHGYHTLAHAAAALTQRALGGAVLWRTENTLLSARPSWKQAVKASALPRYFGGAYGLFIGSENRRWLERWGFPDERLFHAPYAVDNETLRAEAARLAPRRAEVRRELGVKRVDDPVIASVGRLVEKKRPLHLLEAFRELQRELPCTLLVVGSGPLEGELRGQVAREGIEDVVFTGFLDQREVARAYAAADVFALVSAFDETWGLVVNEAMNFGLPVVVSDQVGCAADLVRDGRNGFVVPWCDRAALVGALHALADSPELRERFGAESREAIGPWTYESAVRGVLDGLAAALGADRVPLVATTGSPS